MSAVVVAFKESKWQDEITCKAFWSNLTRSFNVDLQLVTNYDEIIIPEGFKVIVMDETGSVALQDFVHPENAVYILGRSNMSNIQNYIEHDHCVKIEHPEMKSIFGISIAGALLYDRSLQKWQ